MIEQIPDGGQRFTLDQPSIELAIAEIQFAPQPGGVVPQAVGLAFRDRLRAAGLKVERFEPVIMQEVGVEVTQTGGRATTRSATQGWVFNDETTGRAVTFMPYSVAVQAERYVRWGETLRPVLEAAMAAFADMIGPEVRSRIGLRFVNRFVDHTAKTAQHWIPQFDLSLLGPVANGPLAPLIRNTQQQLELAWPDGVVGLLRHGAFIDASVGGAYSYLLDIDLSDSATEKFDQVEVLDRITELDRRSAQIFKNLLSPVHLARRGFKIHEEEEAKDK
jgi:uncharacterized protein (TIGR04255 family)